MKKNTNKKNNINYQSGQILLISLLVMIVVLVIGLSLAARTINTLRTSQVEDNSAKAFSAAEAGIERALTATGNNPITGRLSNTTGYAVSKNTLSGDEIPVSNGDMVLKDEPADVWLANYPNFTAKWSGNLSIYWGSPADSCVAKPESDNSMAALEVVLIHGTKAAPVIDHFAYDPCAPRRNSYNHFNNVLAGGTVDGTNYSYSVTLPVNSGLLMRIIPLYAGTKIGIKGPGLPAQGVIVTSVGDSGGTKRKIVTYQGYPTAPIELFPFLIFSSK